MARGIFHRPVEIRRGKLCYQVGASPRVQIVKRFILEHAKAIGAATEIPTNYRAGSNWKNRSDFND
jgi:hypothetical protein